MNCPKAYALRFLFLIHFLFYITSPLCYAKTDIEKKHVVEKFGLLLWKDVFSTVLSDYVQTDNDGNLRFLLKKKYNRQTINLKAASEHSIAGENFVVLPAIELSAPLISGSRVLHYQGFNTHFSGHSPPNT